MADLKEDPRSFSALVMAIDEKWSHTYEDVPEQPEMTPEMEEYMNKLLEADGYDVGGTLDYVADVYAEANDYRA